MLRWMRGYEREDYIMKEQHHTKSSESTEREHHPDLGPSSFPMLNKCPVWESDNVENEAMTRGTMLHDQFEALVRSRKEKPKRKRAK